MLFVASVALRPNWTLVMVILLLFLGVRILQDATFKVLGVELIVALAALCPIYFAQKTLPQLGQWRSALAVACSLLAFIGLIF